MWKAIEGFYGYEVSDNGSVRSFKNYHGLITDTYHILKPRTNPNGYQIVTLYDDQGIPHQLSVHRLVAKAFLPNTNNYPVVEHLDDDKAHNAVENLEWVTYQENSIRACNAGLYEPIFRKTRRPVMVTDLRTGEQTYFEGVNEAARCLGYSPAIISRVANMNGDKVGHYTIEFAGAEERLLFGNDEY